MPLTVQELQLNIIALKKENHMQNIHPTFRNQQGISLVELLIGLSIGILVIGVATGALMASRGISGTVSDSSRMQQQTAYAMRVIGQQLRQAGSLYLHEPNENEVVFYKRQGNIIDDVSINGFMSSFSSDSTDLSRHCLGGPATSSANDQIKSIFSLDVATNSLRCQGGVNDTTDTAQPIVGNVADFQVRYLVQKDAATGETNITYTDTPASTDQIQGVEVCLVLYGAEAINPPAGSTYLGCDLQAADGKPTPVDMTALSDTRRNNRLHLAFRNVFQLRSQGEL